MIKDITIGQYIPGNSFIHKLDPRFKILISLAFIVNLLLIKSYIGYLVFIIQIAISIVVSQIKPKILIKGLKPIFMIILITSLFNVFMTPGKTLLLNIGFINIYSEGVNTAALMTIRLVFLIVGTSLLTLTTSPIELTDGIEKLLNPFKKIGLPAHELAMMMTIALRFIPTLMDETDKIMKAQMARGADFESGSIINRAKNMIPILVPLFINSFKRAEELADAMEARCYRGGSGRTRMKILKITYRDILATVVVTITFVITLTVANIW